jgi:broad specificity phosphatase PhoE
VVLIRHGETEWSHNGRHTSTTDVPLTDAGRRQARAVGAALGGRHFALVLTSPMARATETAALAGLGDAAQTTDDLREWDYGEYEGRTTAEIRADVAGWTVWTHPCPNGETIADVARRADRVVATARAADGDVALVGHGHQLRVLAARWCDLDPIVGRALLLNTATLSTLSYERETPAIDTWNLSVM